MESTSFLSHVRSKRLLGVVLCVVLSLTLLSGCALVQQLPREATPPLGSSTNSTPVSIQPGSLPPVAEVAAAVRPAVVSIATQEQALDRFLQPTQSQGAGSGVIFDSRGYIITNNHVIESARQMRVILPDGRTFDKVTVVGRDPTTDLAVLKIEGENNLPTAKLGNSDALRVGDWVIAIGNALGLEGGPTVTAGVVGATGRSINESNNVTLDDIIQTDAAINPGNSGGPLVNLAGEIVGINTAIDSRGQGIGFAIGITSAKPIVDELVRNGRIVRAYMGVTVATMNPSVAAQLGIPPRDGVAIVTVPRGGPAAQAGLRTGDVVINIDSTAVKTARDVQNSVRNKKPGDRLNLTILRGGNQQNVTVILGELPSV